jgi:hypothetical protein
LLHDCPQLKLKPLILFLFHTGQVLHNFANLNLKPLILFLCLHDCIKLIVKLVIICLHDCIKLNVKLVITFLGITQLIVPYLR